MAHHFLEQCLCLFCVAYFHVSLGGAGALGTFGVSRLLALERVGLSLQALSLQIERQTKSLFAESPMRKLWRKTY